MTTTARRIKNTFATFIFLFGAAVASCQLPVASCHYLEESICVP